MDNGAGSYRRFLEGDESGFDELMNTLFHHLVFFINRYVHDIHIAEDIAMDVFADLIVHKHRYNFKVTLKTYVFMLGRSRALDYLKHCKVVSFVALSESEPDQMMLEEMVLVDEQKRAVNSAINQLPEDMRIAIHLVYFEGLTYRETAKVMKKKEKQVDNLLYRAKGRLRTLLGEESEWLC